MIYRIDVRDTGSDPLGQSVRQQIHEMGYRVAAVASRRVYLIDSPMDSAAAARVARDLLADPIVESAELIGESPDDQGRSRIEIHLKPGVMDPVAASTEMAIADLGFAVNQVRTGRVFLIDGRLEQVELDRIARSVLANGVIESVHFDCHRPTRFETGRQYTLNLASVSLRNLSDDELVKLSRSGHLFLSLPEMKAIQAYFRQQNREPTDIELETIAQTWSEHCVHKTLKSAVHVTERDASGRETGRRQYKNLIKETIFDSTMRLMQKDNGANPFCLSVFKDNAGVIRFDEHDAVCFKVETHNHPSAIEPYGGSATGIGGVIRDILGTGLAARPVANTDIFCVAHPNRDGDLPKGIIHPRRILRQIVAGVRDYGNRMGIPTVNGAVYFDDRYLGNPLVFCGCVGLIPQDKIEKASRDGDAIVVMGGRTGRDGVHGATFSSGELTDTHAEEFSHAVQIGNAITEKKVADVLLAARDRDLFSAVTDCGAGGLSSAVGEMGADIGAQVELEKVPLKYAGLRHDEIWISEAQERMVLAVPPAKVSALLALAESENVQATVIGRFGTPQQELVLRYESHEVGRLSMEFLHDGVPMPVRNAVIVRSATAISAAAYAAANQSVTAAHVTATHATPTHAIATQPAAANVHPAAASHAAANIASSVGKSPAISGQQFKDRLLKLLASPNIASKHWIIRQYDHEVQGGSVIKPLIGPLQIGPSDAAVIRPKLNSFRGVALGCGMVPSITDPYDMAIASIDEAIRNVVAVGADPANVAILDNFCWPSVDDERTMGTLVAACEACRDAALAYGIPFISGKDSLHNQFTNSETGEVLRIPNTLLISAIGVIADVRRCVTMDFKSAGSAVCLVRAKDTRDLSILALTHRLLAACIAGGKISAVHDVSDGGAAVAAAEMCIASGLGLKAEKEYFLTEESFAEQIGAYLIEVADSAGVDALRAALGPAATVGQIGITDMSPTFAVADGNKANSHISLSELTASWRGTLDW